MKKLIAGFMLLGVLMFSAPVARAVTIDDLYKEIQGLKEQVSVLKAQVGGKVLGETITTTSTLYKGIKGDGVLSIQAALKEEGYIIPKVDGVFGPITEAAVKAHQKAEGLPVTGVVDSKTKTSILGTNVISPVKDFLPGCNAITKYSATTGRACDGSQESLPCPAGYTGIYPNCVLIVIDTTPICPEGWTGTYPNCVPPVECPEGWTGTYPNCVPPVECPEGWTGTYPNCMGPSGECPEGWTGTYPNCLAPSGDFPFGCSSNSGFSATTGMACSDGSPLISYWYGKVNQHTDPITKKWSTDPDGTSGANLSKLTYCKKWFPSTKGVTEFKNQTLVDWHAAGNIGNYTSIKMSYKCVQ